MALLLASAGLALAATLFVIYPVLGRRPALLSDTVSGEVLDAEARRRVALTSLKELEYDYVAGKLDESDYRSMRERLSREALQAIRSAGAVGAAPGADAPQAVGHGCGFANPAGSRFCAGCGERLV